MNDVEALEAIRLADSLLPVGSYAVSYGLEQFVQSGRVAGADDLASLLSTYLGQQLGRADLVALRAAHGSAREEELSGVCRADRRVEAVTTSAEFRRSSRAEGSRLLALQRDLGGSGVLDSYADRVEDGRAPGTQPAVLGVVTAVAGVSERAACLVHCHRFVAGSLAAAQRLMSLGHTEAQRILTDLQPEIVAAIDAGVERSLERMAPFTPEVDVLAAEHERADRRLFTS